MVDRVVFANPLRDDCPFREPSLMPTYLVRTVDEHDLVGIFVAPNLIELALLIDEGLDPGVCEYQRMAAGGIMWTAPATAIPTVEHSDLTDEEALTADDPIPWAGASFTESWDDSVHGYSKATKWRRLEFDLNDLYSNGPDEEPPAPKRLAGPARVLPFRKRAT